MVCSHERKITPTIVCRSLSVAADGRWWMTSNRVCDGSFGPSCESQVRSSSIICQRIYHAYGIFVRTCSLSRYKFSVTIFSRIATLQARVQNATYGCRWSVVCLSVYCERWLSRSRCRFGVNSVEPKEPCIRRGPWSATERGSFGSILRYARVVDILNITRT